MQLGAVIDTVIGVAFVFFLLALASSAVAEWVATVTKKRAKYLLRTLRDVLRVPDTTAPVTHALGRLSAGLGTVESERRLHNQAMTAATRTPPASGAARAVNGEDSSGAPTGDVVHGTPSGSPLDLTSFYAHALVAPLVQTTADGRVTRLPSYIPAKTFVDVVLDAVLKDQKGQDSLTRLNAAVSTADLPQSVRSALGSALSQAEGSMDKVRTHLEDWYDATMERVSGSYKRWTKRWLLVIAAGFVLVLHVDALSMAQRLYSDTTVRQAVVAAAQSNDCSGTNNVKTCLEQTRKDLADAGLPIGLPKDCAAKRLDVCLFGGTATERPGFGAAVLALIGMALSVLAASFGAPFWFDVLTRAANLRNTGAPPKTDPANAGTGSSGARG